MPEYQTKIDPPEPGLCRHDTAQRILVKLPALRHMLVLMLTPSCVALV